MGKKTTIKIVVAITLISLIWPPIRNSRYEADVLGDGIKDTAVVDRFYTAHFRKYFEYSFFVDGKIYHGDRRIIGDEIKKVNKGDSIVIIYKKTNPKKSIPYNIVGQEEILGLFPL